MKEGGWLKTYIQSLQNIFTFCGIFILNTFKLFYKICYIDFIFYSDNKIKNYKSSNQIVLKIFV